MAEGYILGDPNGKRIRMKIIMTYKLRDMTWVDSSDFMGLLIGIMIDHSTICIDIKPYLRRSWVKVAAAVVAVKIVKGLTTTSHDVTKQNVSTELSKRSESVIWVKCQPVFCPFSYIDHWSESPRRCPL